MLTMLHPVRRQALAGDPPPEPWEHFQDSVQDGTLLGWPCRKATQVGELHLFYFGRPHAAIRALGIAACAPYPVAHPGPRASGRWFCDFSHVVLLPPPFSTSTLQEDPLLGRWWAARPYRGGFRLVPERVVRRLSERLWRGNRAVARLLARREAALARPERAGHASPEHLEFRDSRLAIDLEEPPGGAGLEPIRVIRDGPTVRMLKELYDHTCQACGEALLIPDPCRFNYVESHHLRPLGRPHHGLDEPGNILILCPGCHAAFDLLATRVDPRTLRLERFDGTRLPRRKLRVHKQHRLERRHLEYHDWLVETALQRKLLQ